MGKLDTSNLRYLKGNDLRLLAAVEYGMKYNEYVPILRIAHLARIGTDGLSTSLRDLSTLKLLCYESKKNEGYRLTNQGYDYLALSNLVNHEHITYFGNQIGVGKESNIYIVANSSEEELCLKVHRLGRTSFKNVKNKRDYHKYTGGNNSWLNLSRISAAREFDCMNALYARKFPIPRPIGKNRHCVVMELIKGDLLDHIKEVEDCQTLYSELIELIMRFANAGLVHGDFNEFNIILTKDEKPVIIDFPQMISTMHPEAEMYFNRDVNCINVFFERRFGYISEDYPKFSDIVRDDKIDCEIMCSGVTKAKMRELGLMDDKNDETLLSSLTLEDKSDDPEFVDNFSEKDESDGEGSSNSNDQTKKEGEVSNEEENREDTATNGSTKSKKGSKLYAERMKLFGFDEEGSNVNSDDEEDETCSQARSTSVAEMRRRKMIQKQIAQQKRKSERVTAHTKSKRNNKVRKENQQTIRSNEGIWG